MGGWTKKIGTWGMFFSSSACYTLARGVTDVSRPDEHLSGVKPLNNRSFMHADVHMQRTAIAALRSKMNV